MDVFLQDSSSTIGAGLSGLVFNTSNLKAYYRKGATGTLTAITLATQTVGGAWSSGGFVEIDATNAKGLYRFDIPDTILASSPAAIIHFYGASNLAQNFSELEIVSYNPFDGVRLGLTALPNTTPGASGGILISGSNSGTTTLGALTVTGTATISDGIVVTRSSSNTDGISVTGNGTGNGIKTTSGSGATGDGFRSTSSATSGHGIVSIGAGNGNGFLANGAGTGSGFSITGGATGNGIFVHGGGTSGDGIKITTTSGHGVEIAPLGTSMHGIVSTGGDDGTSDGMKLVAGTGGVDLRANQTGNLTGTVTSSGDFTIQMSESYSALHAAPTPAQALFQILSMLNEKAVAATTLTAKKVDGSTTAMTFTLDSAVTPTSITRAS